MGAVTKTLYETDFVEWTERTAALLRAGRFDEADIEHAAEEIEDLGRSERSAVASQLKRMLMHLLKQRIQPERDGVSWRRSIVEGRSEIEFRFDDSPSLRRYAEERPAENLPPRGSRRAGRNRPHRTTRLFGFAGGLPLYSRRPH